MFPESFVAGINLLHKILRYHVLSFQSQSILSSIIFYNRTNEIQSIKIMDEIKKKKGNVMPCNRFIPATKGSGNIA